MRRFAEIGATTRLSRRILLKSVGAGVVCASAAYPCPASKSPASPSALGPCIDQAAAWLIQRQRKDGLFDYGHLPGVNRPMREDNLLRQAGAAASLARYARFADNRRADEASAAAADAMLRCTAADGEMRRSIRPADECHPVGFSALLLWCLTELIEAGSHQSRLSSAESLAVFLSSRQRSDGAIDVGASHDPDGVEPAGAWDYFPGEALFAMARSMRVRPADWKYEVIDRARPIYAEYFADTGSLAFIPWQLSAFAEAFCQRRKRHDAEFAFLMADRLVQTQYGPSRRPRDAEWIGGFGAYDGAEFVPAPPGIVAACYAEGLACAARCAREAGDDERFRQYRQSWRLAVTFIERLQFREENTGHFEPNYRLNLLGAFHGGLEDDSVRIDFNQHALTAMLAEGLE